MKVVQLTKQTIKVGNSSGVLLPKDWLGSEVTVILKKEQLDIKKDILKLLTPHFKKVLGIYIVGSYAREELTLDSDVDILIITSTPIKLPKFKNYHFIPASINSVKDALKTNPILIYPMIIEAKPILNEFLLKELRMYKINTSKFRWFIETSKTSLNVNKEILNIEEIEGNKLFKSLPVIYSLILRLRGAYIIDCILKNKTYSNKNLIKFVDKKLGKELFKKMYKVYVAVRDHKKIPKYEITLDDVRKLYKFVKDMIKKEEKLI